MFNQVSVLVPTRRRIQRLVTMIESFERTMPPGEAHTAELIFRTDMDDPASGDYLRGRGYRVIEGLRLDGYHSMPTFFNQLAAEASGDVVMCGNDDMIFRTSGWASKLLATANRFPDGLFNVGVHTHNEDHFPFSTVSKRVIEQLGFLWDPRIFWGDIYLRDIMTHFRRAVRVDDVEIEHDWAGNVPDETFTEADKDIVKRYPLYWSAVHAPAVQEAIAKLEGLLQ